jgi:L-aminopeptidase/D-esterase-like protein
VAEGNVGAGAGATVGKMGGRDRAMKGGIGSAAITLPNGLVVAALVAVNARGDIVDPWTGQVVAGMRTEDGRGLADVRRRLKSGQLELPLPEALQHTTLGVVATNARLTKTQATKVAQLAHDGLARAIVPAHTSADGDAIFALATNVRTTADDPDTIGTLAAEVMSEAILRAVRAATSIPGYPAARDLR